MYKHQYESIGQEIAETFENNKRYMDETRIKLNYHMDKADEDLSKMSDRLNILEGTVMNHKFDIDKLQAKTTVNADTIKKN